MNPVRLAVAADVPAIVDMALVFLATEYAGAIAADPVRVEAMAATMVHEGAMFVAERQGDVVGMIGMVVYDHFLSGERVASPVCWWVNPDARGLGMRLFIAGRRWAIAQGATRLQASAPNRRSEQIYRRLGWTAFEVHYQTRLT